ncbi:MAG: hypothetical protein JW940_11645 [Polyangiaceae bacterium]|nr:hypothetical protein [Polyangiaceae bacterium]
MAGYHCVDSEEAGASVCTPYPTLGESCSSERSCDSSSYCELDALICRALPGEGELCGTDAITGNPGWCAQGLFCVMGSAPDRPVCSSVPAEGEPCLLRRDTGEPILSCADQAWCDVTATPPVCKAPIVVGETCSNASDCEAGAYCLCDDESCTTRSCAFLRIGGEPCDDQLTKCFPDYSCVAGVCESGGSRGLFEEACGT